MNTKLLVRSVPLGIFALILLSLCAATAAFNIPAVVVSSAPAAASPTAVISSIFTPQIQRWGEKIVQWAGENGLDPNLVATVMQIESCGRADAVSRAGAQGLFQVMPFHFADGESMTDPETNARRGVDYLARALGKAEGDVSLALAGYNGGHSVIGWPAADWPAETKRYVYWGSGIFADATGGSGDSPRLREWLAAGGTRLCILAG
jgi:soluble lytic murein transglycosylase-like protein